MGQRAEAYGPRGDASRHLALAALERGLEQLSAPPRERGTLELIVARQADGVRERLNEIALTPGDGVPGDRWGRLLADKPELQLTAIRRDVAELVGNGQDVTVSGDNLYVDLDLSAANLPTGTRLRLGEALVEVSAMPHDGCVKFKDRFGADALRLVSGKAFRDLNLRGIYWTTVQAGTVRVGDAIEVLSRP